MTTKTQTQDRIAALRTLMAQDGIDAVIIPQADPHMSEYLASHWQVRRWLSGFTGSAGSLLVTSDKALLWTDSRYFLQAADELDGTDIVLMKEGLPETPSIAGWLCSNLHCGATVGIDGMLFSLSESRALDSALKRKGLLLKPDFDVIDHIWADRPALPKARVIIHELKYAGESAESKLKRICELTEAEDADGVLISALDEIAWTLNIRSRDVTHNPVATAYLYISRQSTVLLIDPEKLTPDVTEYLSKAGVSLLPYTDIKSFVSSLQAEAKVLIQPDRTAVEIAELLGMRVREACSPVALLKACKNAVQVDGIRNAMRRDGVALVYALMELEGRLERKEPTSELDVAALLLKHRSASDMFFDESFGTIAGYGAHGAIVHYEADETTNAMLQPQGLLLIDSGAQYFDGTTDITRTIALGRPTDQERHDFTLVMKGHIALARARFPEGTTGHQLDVLARQYLWQEGLSYLHGTGHGVGHFLNVHEGPQSIRLNHVPTPLMPGMITSNEPGLYRTGVHGIRCENLILTVDDITTEFGKFLRFETLTLFPFDLRLFDTDLMTDGEIAWINTYHRMVLEQLAPMLDEPARLWLGAKTAPLVRGTIY